MLKGTYTTEHKTITESVGVALSGIYGYFLNLNYEMLIVLVLLMTLDIITGVLFSFKRGDFKTSVMKKGLILKLLIMTLLAALVLFQIVLETYGIIAPFSGSVTGILCFMELLSMLETFSENGVKLPAIITGWFSKAKEKIENEEEL